MEKYSKCKNCDKYLMKRDGVWFHTPGAVFCNPYAKAGIGLDQKAEPTNEPPVEVAGTAMDVHGNLHDDPLDLPKLPTETQQKLDRAVAKIEAELAKHSVLPTDAKARKSVPITTGVLDYFPLALAAVAECSRVGNEQHNPGEPLHWARGKSTDQADCIVRHLIDRGKIDTDGVRHSAKVAWRALALLQLEIEADQ